MTAGRLLAQSARMSKPVYDSMPADEFVRKYGTPYDPATDDYERSPFVADIKEGKNDPIYNAHSYHTKVPPRAIIPYILHYTEPGDIVLDPFCGSGMTGVAALLCEKPPEDILEMVKAMNPGRKIKPGARRAILNDLSPAACHIAYNYCTPVDVEELKREFERIKAAVKDEFDWLYGTEHYEPAVGPYDPKNSDVAARLKNPPRDATVKKLLTGEDRSWELLTRSEVEVRLGYSVAALPCEDRWHELDVRTVEQWVCIPASIQYTVWSDVYKCEGFVTVEEPTGKVSTRGKNIGKPIVKKKRLARGCANEIVIWHVAIASDGQVAETFKCPHCSLPWKKAQLRRVGSVPVTTNLSAVAIRNTKVGAETHRLRYTRPVSVRELSALSEMEATPIPYWVPDTEMDTKGPQYRRNALQVRKIRKVTDFWSARNLRAYASLWARASAVKVPRVRDALRFSLTGITYYVTKKQSWGSGGGGLSGQLYLSSFPLEKNVLEVLERKVKQLLQGYASARFIATSRAAVVSGSATVLPLPDRCVDYVFADPPFGSNIYYSEPNLLWEAWLGDVTDTSEEAVVHRKNDGGTKRLSDYARLMHAAFREICRVLKPGRWATVEFNNSDGEVFEAIKSAARGAGLQIENMLFLDKDQKTFKQVKGVKGEEDVVGHDVLFNLYKPGPSQRVKINAEVNGRFEHLVVDTIREHLRGLPDRIMADAATYSDEHRTTPFLNTMLMNALIPKGVNVERLNLPFIEAVCARYFRKVDNRWHLRDEQVRTTVNADDGALLIRPEAGIEIRDETTAIDWLRRCLSQTPMRIGDLRPHWMRATVHLTGDVSTKLEKYLQDHFWLDRQTRKWREPSEDERRLLDNADRQRAGHDAERFLHGSLREQPADSEILEWIGHLYDSATLLEEDAVGLTEAGQAPEIPDEALRLYAMMPQLLQRVLKERVDPQRYALAQRQCRIAGAKLADLTERNRTKRRTEDGSDGQLTLFGSAGNDD